jgi:aminopeptidase N
MEYPMMTCLGGTWDSLGMYEVTVHEIAHMWFPMLVGSDEKRHSWMDEGLTQFNQSQGIADFYQGRLDDERQNRTIYLSVAQARREGALMVHGDKYADGMAFGIASYFKPATMLVTLREILGRQTFERAWREYAARWRFRHPKPYDLFATFEDVSGRDLDWFWRSWAFETWTMDQAIAGVVRVGDRVEITVEDRGKMPLPARLAITRAGGRVDRMEIPVEAWLAGATRQTVTVAAEPAVVRVVIDPEMVFPDVDRRNQTWRAP